MLDPVRFYKSLLVMIVVLCVPNVLLAINLNGSWTYRENGGDGGETFRDFRQNYSFGVGPALSYQPSHALSGSASVGYTQVNGVDEQGSRTNRTITPTVGFSLINDIFSARISGSTANVQSDGGDWRTSTNWNTILDSRWIASYIPQFQLSYGESGDSSQGDVVSTAEAQRKNFSASVDWDLMLADMSYNYRHTRSDELATSQSHFVKLKTGGRFWNDRIMFNVSQQAQFDVMEVSGGALGESVTIPGEGAVNVGAISSLISVDVGCNFGVECLGGVVPFSYTAPEHRVLIAVTPAANSSISVVDIQFDISKDDQGDGSTWVLYDDSSGSWQPVVDQPPLIAMPVLDTDGRVRDGWQRISIPATEQNFMLVSDRPRDGAIIAVDIFEVFPLRPGGSGRENWRYLTSAGIQALLSETLTSSLVLTYERNESNSDAAAEFDNTIDKISTNASLSWSPFSFLVASVGAAEYRELKQGEEQQLNRNYSLNFGTNPLETLRVGYGVRLSERYGIGLENGAVDIDQKTLETLLYSINGKAQIYPDLTASFNLSYSEGKRWLKDEGADTGRFADNTGQLARLELNAILYKDVTADVTTTYSQSEDGGIDRESGSVELGLRYRLSKLMLVSGSYATDIIGGDDTDLINLRVQARLLDTSKTHLQAQLSHTQAEESEERIDLNGSWLINKTMSLVGRAGYSIGETNNYNLRLDLRIGI